MARNLAERNVAARRQTGQNITSATEAYRSMGQQHLENLGQVRSQHEALRQRREERKAREQDAEQKELQRIHEKEEAGKDRELEAGKEMRAAKAAIVSAGGTNLEVLKAQLEIAQGYNLTNQANELKADIKRIEAEGAQDLELQRQEHEDNLELLEKQITGDKALQGLINSTDIDVAEIRAAAMEVKNQGIEGDIFEYYHDAVNLALEGEYANFYRVDDFGNVMPNLDAHGGDFEAWHEAKLAALEGKSDNIDAYILQLGEARKWTNSQKETFKNFFWARAGLPIGSAPASGDVAGGDGVTDETTVTPQVDPDSKGTGNEGIGTAEGLSRPEGKPSQFFGRTLLPGTTDQVAFMDAFIDKGETNTEPKYRLFDETADGPRPAENYDEVRRRLEKNFDQNLTKQESPVAERIWEVLEAMANGTLIKDGDTYGYEDLPSIDDLTLMARNLREMYADREEQFSNPNAIIRQMNSRFSGVQGYTPLAQSGARKRTAE